MNLLKDKKLNILILGGGVSAERFVESFVFNNNLTLTVATFNEQNKSINLATKYGLEYIFFYDINNFNNYDVIITSIPVKHKYKIIKHIIDKNFKNKFIIEKPFCLTLKDTKLLLKLIEENDFVVPYTRSYLEELYNFNYKNDIFIWNIPDDDNLDIYQENLPHILQLLIDNNFNLKNINIKIKEQNKLEIICGNSLLTIIFQKNNGIYKLNNNDSYKINYRVANNKMLNYLLKEDYDRRKQIEDLYANISAFEKIYYEKEV